MDKLTTEQKAQRYDEVLERVVNIRTGKCETTFIFTEGLFDYLFPELEECNEEEVRKAMIDFFKHEREEGVVVFHYGVNIERMIAWLEKQGQVNETIISQHENKTCKENNYSLTSEDERIRKYLLSMFSDPNDSWDGISAREIIAWLEKQGEQKPADKVESKFKVGDIIINIHYRWDGKHRIREITNGKYIFDNGSYINIKEQDSWELVDKVEPKFHEGEWVVSPNSVYWHIDRIENNRYEVTSNTGESSNWNLDTNIYHKFTIQDAKDGDVLADNVGVILFKSIGDNNVINFHAYFSGLFAVQEGEHYWGHVRECTLSPATKEQRERFFAAMNDAGFEWDAEKKELKKISKNI